MRKRTRRPPPRRSRSTHPPAPCSRPTLTGSIQLIKDGKRDLAMASLRALWKKTPNSSSIPFLLGNLYFDQRWWAVAMEHYTAAIKKKPSTGQIRP
jgi:TolA-binding protein